MQMLVFQCSFCEVHKIIFAVGHCLTNKKKSILIPDLTNTQDPTLVKVQKYLQANFLLLKPAGAVL